jgi:hypothetical protein
MSALALAMMVAICGLVWGGFGVFLTLALRHEGRRTAGRER